MHKTSVLLIGIIALGMVFFQSCVSSRLYKELEEKNLKCNEERESLLYENEELKTRNNEFESKIEQIHDEIERYSRDSLKLVNQIQQLKAENKRLQNQYDDLKNAQEALIKGNAEETKRLLRQLQATQGDLEEREQKLHELESTLEERRRNLDELKNELENRNARLIELQRILDRKDSAVNALREKVSQALLGFENEGLQVTMKNGKVYVSLEEQLLFKTGSRQVDPKGERALKRLADVLEDNPDINIMIEGHTDDVPYKSGAVIKDNWDLSVLRATSIVRIILNNSTIDPKRLTASGRGEHMPVDPADTPEARRKNRRTEIILTPKLNELFEILEAN